MAIKPCVLEFGSGVDLRGGDYTKAAAKAVDNAIHHCSLFVRGYVDSLDKLLVDVTVAVPRPEPVNVEEILQVLPVGQKKVKVVAGGLSVPYMEGGEELVVMAQAAVRVSLDIE
jgi:uncharacterized protein (TIGR02058 family)